MKHRPKRVAITGVLRRLANLGSGVRYFPCEEAELGANAEGRPRPGSWTWVSTGEQWSANWSRWTPVGVVPVLQAQVASSRAEAGSRGGHHGR